MTKRRNLVLALAVVLATVWAAPTLLAEDMPCPANFQSWANLPEGKSVRCSCDAGLVTGTVYGTDRYTSDSSLCTAAVHAGAISAAKGGVITVFREGRCPRIAGSVRNGVSSRDWGPYDVTFAFKHPIACSDLIGLGTPSAPCPANLRGYEGRPSGALLECTCSAAQISGTVWGSDVYTFDSSLCNAARHAGVVSESGGKVKVFAGGRCESMAPTTRNGVTTSKWGGYDNTFGFKWPLPNCPSGNPPAPR